MGFFNFFLLSLLWILFCATTTNFGDLRHLWVSDFKVASNNSSNHWCSEPLRTVADAAPFWRVGPSGASKSIISNLKPDTKADLNEISTTKQICRPSRGKRRISRCDTSSLYLQLVSTRLSELQCPLSDTGESPRLFGVIRVVSETSADGQKSELSNLSAVSNSKRKELLLRNYLLGMELAKQQAELRRAHEQVEENCRRNWHFSHYVPATGSRWTIVVTMLLLVAIPIFGWCALGEAYLCAQFVDAQGRPHK